MKNFFLLLIFLSIFSCKKNSESSKNNKIVIKNTNIIESDDYNDANNQSETYLKVKINNEEVKEIYGNFNGEGGSKLTGSLSNFVLEVPENIFAKNTHNIKLNHSKKSLPPMLKLGRYNIKGLESDKDYIENNKEDTFYCMNALTMNTYNKLLEVYKTLNKDALLEVLHFNFVVVPDEKNNFTIESIKEINNAKEFFEISNGKGIRNNKFIIEGKFQIKLMKISSKEEFLVQSKFKTEYDYGYNEI
ncbi:hypothetical protein PG911_14595 [Tenacibaculum ovolyticum]|uniref:hypothetical protein n=1 Tax=Tenacibaculum ovolyticum TaxID=104270 RepID=UPI0022F3F8BE|nr:hypothetical protein [Tenacibaculum ovolyticum]WBX75865.1 hypothetical protein PG911_14595 [Tenacibaculum ovolyticum]